MRVLGSILEGRYSVAIEYRICLGIIKAWHSKRPSDVHQPQFLSTNRTGTSNSSICCPIDALDKTSMKLQSYRLNCRFDWAAQRPGDTKAGDTPSICPTSTSLGNLLSVLRLLEAITTLPSDTRRTHNANWKVRTFNCTSHVQQTVPRALQNARYKSKFLLVNDRFLETRS